MIVPVRTAADVDAFHALPADLYGHDPDWVAARPEDVEPLAAGSERWLWVDQGRCAGRIAVYRDLFLEEGRRVGGFGFLDGHPIAMQGLLDQAMTWLRGEGMHAIEGPGHAGERDRFWGAVTTGFGAPLFLENHNGPELVQLLTSQQFAPRRQTLTYDIPLSQTVSATLTKWAAAASFGDVTFTHLDPRRPDAFIAGLHQVYVDSFAAANRPSMLDDRGFAEAIAEAATQLDPRLFLLLSIDGQPVAALASMPEHHHTIRAARVGRTEAPVAKGFLFAVRPRWQGTGAAIMLAARGLSDLYDAGYRRLFLTGIGAQTAGMRSLAAAVGARHVRTHASWIRTLNAIEGA